MCVLFIFVLIDAVILVGCISAISGDEVEFAPAAGIALVASLVMLVISFVLSPLGVILGSLIASVIIALVVGVLVSAVFGTEIKRAFLIAVAFIAVDTFLRFGLVMAFNQ